MSSPSPDELARALVAIEHHNQIATAQSTAAADIGAAKAYDLAHVTRTVMRETVQLSQLEEVMATAVPSAAGRLRTICDVAALCLTRVAVDGTAQAMLTDGGREVR